MTIRRWLGGAGILAAALMLLPATAEAQFLDRGVQITAWGGPYGALGVLGNDTRQGISIAETRMDDGVGFGGSVEVPIPIERLSVRGGVSLVPSATLETSTFLPCPLPSSDPAIGDEFVDRCRGRSDGTLLTGTADLMYRTQQDFTRPHGVFIIGFGLKNFSFDDEITMLRLPSDPVQATVTGECAAGDYVCNVHRDFTGSTTDPTLHLAFGLSGSLGGVNFTGEVADYVSIYSHESEGQTLEEIVHDIFLKLSAGVRVF